MPSMFGKDGKKKELIKNLNAIYESIQREHHISPGDFPDVKKMQVGMICVWEVTTNYRINCRRIINFENYLYQICLLLVYQLYFPWVRNQMKYCFLISCLQDALQFQDFTKFQLIKPRLLEVVDKMLAEDIARLMALIPLEENVTVTEPIVKGENRISLPWKLFNSLVPAITLAWYWVLLLIYNKWFSKLKSNFVLVITSENGMGIWTILVAFFSIPTNLRWLDIV